MFAWSKMPMTYLLLLSFYLYLRFRHCAAPGSFYMSVFLGGHVVSGRWLPLAAVALLGQGGAAALAFVGWRKRGPGGSPARARPAA